MNAIRYIYNRVFWMVQLAPFIKPTLRIKRFINSRSAQSPIALCEELGIAPSCIFDIGANESQWSGWIQDHYKVPIESFEPNPSVTPRGGIHRIALSDENGWCSVGAGDDTQACITEDGQIPVFRFDNYWKYRTIPKGSILKIDAQSHSARALIGVGHRIHEFELIIIETCWDNCRCGKQFQNQAASIMKFVLDSGFTCMTSVDEGVYCGRTDFVDMAFWKP